MYREELKSLIIKGVLGFLGGFIFTMAVSPDMGIQGACMMGLGFSTLPYGWQLSGKIVGGLFVVGNIGVMIFSFAIRFGLAFFIGWIAYPIALVSTIIKMRREG